MLNLPKVDHKPGSFFVFMRFGKLYMVECAFLVASEVKGILEERALILNLAKPLSNPPEPKR